MAKRKNNKISISAIEDVMKQEYPVQIKTKEWHGLDLEIKTKLTLEEALLFVNTVVNSCFDTNTSAYTPEAKDFAIRSLVVELYSNVSLPQNLSRRYDILYRTDIYNTVLLEVNLEQHYTLIGAINERVRDVATANINSLNRDISRLFSEFENLQDKMIKSVEGISQDDIRAFASAINNGQLNERALIEAYKESQK